MLKKKISSVLPLSMKMRIRYLRRFFLRIKFHLNTLFGNNKTVNKDNFINCIKSFGISKDDNIFVHSSLSRIGYIEGGAECILESLQEIIGVEGNLCLPAFTTIGSAKSYLESGVIFQPNVTEPTTGRLSKIFVRKKNVKRSIHPTHSIAVKGKDSEMIIDGHENCIKPFGIGSPFEKLLKMNVWILFIGVDIRCMTMFHTFEDLSNNFPMNPYMPKPVIAKIINNNGIEKLVETYVHDPE